MTRRDLLIRLLCASLVLGTTSAFAQGRPFIFGSVRWRSGQPAHGLEVRLQRDGAVVAVTFTSQDGALAFFGVTGQPSEYQILVTSARGVLAHQAVPAIPRGGQIPPIVLD